MTIDDLSDMVANYVDLYIDNEFRVAIAPNLSWFEKLLDKKDKIAQKLQKYKVIAQ